MATANDYEQLHAAMQQAGFSRQITAADGVTYWLPHAEYVLIGTYKLSDVVNSADRAASTTGKKDSVLVTEGTTLSWQGLTKV